MAIVAQTVLILWLPVVVLIFLSVPRKRAVIASFIVAWLALPNIALMIPGFPNYTKMTATTLAVLLCLVAFDFSRLLSVKFRWYDAPMLIWCVIPFYTAISNDLGPYEGLSAMLDILFYWGIPYLIGRIYLTDLASMRDLALGIAIGGFAYIVPCLIEMRLSPILSGLIYGTGAWEGVRYNGYRPRVFLATGLELGLWMANAALVGHQLWACKSVKTLFGVPYVWLMGALVVTSVACRSTGASILLFIGIGVLWFVKITKKSWIVWALIVIPPLYVSSRTTKIWSGREVVDFSQSIFGGERAQSLDFRLIMEDMLVDKAMDRPIWGWGRFGRGLVVNKEGRTTTVPDGYWIIVLGGNGVVGVVLLLIFMLLPIILTIRRFPAKTWRDPQVGPTIVLAMMILLTMIDFLSNAMLNPIFAVVIGGLTGLSPGKLSGGSTEAEKGLERASDLMSDGHVLEAAHEFHRTIQIVAEGEDIPGRQLHARALDGLGHSLSALGRFDEAEGAFHDGLLIRDWLAAHSPDPSRFQDLAIAREGLARLLAETGRPAEAVAERQIALQIWDILVSDHPRDAGYKKHRIEALNDLAWLLVTEPDPAVYNAPLGLSLAEDAVDSANGEHDASWNTLGVARYRMGDWAGAIEALERSALTSLDNQGTAFDHYFLSMAWSRLQHETQAGEWLERGIAWTARHRPGHPMLERFREEADSLWRSEAGPASLGRS